MQAAFTEIAATRGPTAKTALLTQLLSRVTPLEAKYIVKIITGDLRIGLKEGLLEEVTEIAVRYKDCVDVDKIPARSLWRKDL